VDGCGATGSRRETAADIGRRVDRVIERARSVRGDTVCFAHGHVLRVLARPLAPPPAGRAAGGSRPRIAQRARLGARRRQVIARWNEGQGP